MTESEMLIIVLVDLIVDNKNTHGDIPHDYPKKIVLTGALSERMRMCKPKG